METVNNENTHSKDTDPDDNDMHLKLQKLTDRVTLHETEKQEMREEFGLQRAKMKELFLQKEEELKRGSSEHSRLAAEVQRLQAELNEAQTQVTVTRLELENRLDEEKQRNQSEVASLQQLVSETLEESTRYDEEMRRLRRLNEKLESELEEVRGAGGAESGAQLLTAPGAMISTLARKVASQLGADSSSSSSPPSLNHPNAAGHPFQQQGPTPGSGPESLEESMRKVNKYAQEDAEVLRSLVIPLEEEISALKDKLRHTDEQLRKCQGLPEHEEPIHADPSDSFSLPNRTESPNKEAGGDITRDSSDYILSGQYKESASSQSKLSPACEGDEKRGRKKQQQCDMCLNYETQLVVAQDRNKELERQLATLERCREELAKEAVIRKDMEQKWNEKKEVHKAEVNELQKRTKDAEDCTRELKKQFEETRSSVMERLSTLKEEREKVQVQLERLQLENENLVGKRNAHARKLEEEVIDLPNNVEDLQELLLKFREDLISARVGQEAAEQEVGTLKEEAQLRRYQSQAEDQTRVNFENSLKIDIEALKAKLNKCEMDGRQRQLSLQRKENDEKTLRLEMEDIKTDLITTRNAKIKLEEASNELKSRVSSLQAELRNSEIVQQDFVRLSQSLQKELERIRSSHTQLRWEHEEDIEQCPGCEQSFTVTRRKQHCRHCGRVFCTPCLTHTVLSGPKQRPSKVCDVCHTLLVQDTAPYFSTEPPQHSN